MLKKILIIGASGGNLPGVERDVANYKNFFLSSLGGAWLDSEIVTLESPAPEVVRAQLKNLSQLDYSVVVFAGHGSHPKQDGATFVQLQPKVSLSADELKVGAPKHTLILDCCRQLEPEIIMDSAMEALAKAAQQIDKSECRKWFEYSIAACSKGLVTMFACDIDETAGETRRGGFYSSALLSEAQSWQLTKNIDTSKEFLALSVTAAHTRAEQTVKRISGGRQNPVCEYPRVDKQFPFAIIA